MIPAAAEMANDVFGVSQKLLLMFELALLKPRGRLSSPLKSYRTPEATLGVMIAPLPPAQQRTQIVLGDALTKTAPSKTRN